MNRQSNQNEKADDLISAWKNVSCDAITVSITIPKMGDLLRMMAAAYTARLSGNKHVAHLAEIGRTKRIRKKNRKRCIKIMSNYQKTIKDRR